jgi:D-alanine-D-alanine ligase
VAKVRVAVVMGGASAEREVSLKSGQTALGSLDRGRYDVIVVDPGLPSWIQDLMTSPRPDVALLCLHGPGGEDGALQGFLQTVGIPYTGSGVTSSALCMNKDLTKTVLRAAQIPVPQSLAITEAERRSSDFASLVQALPLPLVVKPNRQGSTRGGSKVTDRSQVAQAVDNALAFDSLVLLEECVSGTEITVSVLGGDKPQALPIVEIIPQSGFYDYYDKYTPGATEEVVPARIPERRAEEARQYALSAHRRLGCWGVSRTDMIVAEHQTWVLEVNTIPGLTPTSLLPCAVRAAGMTMSALFDLLIDLARTRPEG